MLQDKLFCLGDAFFGGYCAAQSLRRNPVVIHGCAGCTNMAIDKNLQLLNLHERYRFFRNITKMTDEHIIKGGDLLLYNTICETVQTYRSNRITVITNHIPETIGDAGESVCRRAEKQLGVSIAYAACGGMRQSYMDGFSQVLSSLIYKDRWISVKCSGSKRVNIFGLYPYIDPYFHGNRLEFERMFAGMGIEINFYSGDEYALENVESILDAQLNISFGKEFQGLLTKIKNEAGVMFLEYPNYPIGVTQTIQLLKDVSSFFQIDATCWLEECRRRYYSLLVDSLDELKTLQKKKVGLIAIPQYASGLLTFLSEELDMHVEVVQIMYNSENQIELKNVDDGCGLQDCDVIFGRYHEQYLYGENCKVLQLTPFIRTKMLETRPYVGIYGGISIIADLLR